MNDAIKLAISKGDYLADYGIGPLPAIRRWSGSVTIDDGTGEHHLSEGGILMGEHRINALDARVKTAWLQTSRLAERGRGPTAASR